MRGRARPVVLFVDDHAWASFDQVAVGLRRRGLQTVKVTTRPQASWRRSLREPHLRRLQDHLFFNEVVTLGTSAGDARLSALLNGGQVADVIAAEPTLLHIGLDSPWGRRLAAAGLAYRGSEAMLLLDKFRVNTALAGCGVATPAQIAGDQATPVEAAARLGLPLVIKACSGAGGDQVRIAHSVDEIERAVGELAGAPLFYQAHVDGEMVLYGGVLGPDGPIMEHGFAVSEAQYAQGPSSRVRLLDDPALLEAGRCAARAFGIQGFASFGFMQDGQGRLFHVDANCRVWGMICAALPLGIDFLDAYAALILGRAFAEPVVKGDRRRDLPVFPFQALRAADAGDTPRLLQRLAQLSVACWRSLGLAYCAVMAARGALLLGRRWRGRRAGMGLGAARPAANAAR